MAAERALAMKKIKNFSTVAIDKEKHQELYEDDKLNFFQIESEVYKPRFQEREQWIDNDVNFILAKEENFIDELKKADTVYMRGGDTFKLLDFLRKFPEFKDLIKDKVVAGSSAGAYVLAKYFYENDVDVIGEGIGILPIKIIAHYDEAKHKEIIKKLEKTGEDMELVLLREFESKVFEV